MLEFLKRFHSKRADDFVEKFTCLRLQGHSRPTSLEQVLKSCHF